MKQFLRKIRLFWKQMLLNLKRRRRISNYRRTSPRRKAASAIKRASLSAPKPQIAQERAPMAAPSAPKAKPASAKAFFAQAWASICGFFAGIPAFFGKLPAFFGKVPAFFRKIPQLFAALPGKFAAFFRATPSLFRKMSRKAIVSLATALVLVIATPIAVSAAVKNSEQKSEEQAQAALSTAVLTAPQPEEPPRHAEPGMTNPVVSKIQSRLIELSYMGEDEPTLTYTEQIGTAVGLFQRSSGLEQTGVVDEATYTALFAEDAPKYAVSEGMDGDDVTELQHRLWDLGYMSKATGHYGSETTAAVQKFQERNGLAVDGAIGEQTREQLYSEEAKANVLSKGEVSEDIRTYQNRLKTLGYLTTDPDGKYGDDTVAAVKRFQMVNGLISDGYIGQETRLMLLSDNAEYNSISIGASGDDVTRIQERLKELNYMSKVTGYFGEDTNSALKSFQKQNGLTADGKFGTQTNAKLFSDSAKKAPANSKPSKGGSSGGSSKPSDPGSSNSAGVEAFIAAARSKLGCRYVLGAKGPNQFDCSGLVYWALNKAGVKQGYMTSYAWRSTSRYQRLTSMSSIRRGDVIVFKMGGTRGHVGIAVSGDTMIDASTSNGKVVQRSFRTSYWNKYFYCAYRIF